MANLRSQSAVTSPKIEIYPRSRAPTHYSVASFLVLGGKPPNVPTEKTESNLYARASASETYIFRSPNASARTINAVPFYYGIMGAVYTV